MRIENRFTEALGLRMPLIMAPMFLVSNEEMMKAGMRAGIMATFPTLNYRDKGQLEAVLDGLNAFREGPECRGSYGVNLIVQQTNIYYKKHLAACVERKVPFYITSLGNPKEVIEAAHSYGAKVFCDVTNMKHAEKAVSLGADGLIAVGQGAGGHAGVNSLQVFIPALKDRFPHVMIAAAGGVADGRGMAGALALAADAVSVGTRFIATPEAGVNADYKQAIVDYGIDDIVMTDKISGTPCAVINTPYVKKIGTKQGWFGRWLNKNKRTRKWFKTLTQLRGMRALDKAANKATYRTVWCAGQTIGLIDEITPVEGIVDAFAQEYADALAAIPRPETDKAKELAG